jgi:hypothetical protein
MTRFNSLLLGSAAGIVASFAAQAADLFHGMVLPHALSPRDWPNGYPIA